MSISKPLQFLLVFAVIILISVIIYWVMYNPTQETTPASKNTTPQQQSKKDNPKLTVRKHSHDVAYKGAYEPDHLVPVYKSPNVPLGGKGQKIVIVSAFVYDKIHDDFSTFCHKYRINKDVLTVHNLGTVKNSLTNDWSVETCLDTQWARVLAPEADIIVVNAVTNGISHMRDALIKAVSLKPDFVSMSWGAGESNYIADYMEHIFRDYPEITFLAASGDWLETSYPSSSPNVISVGGTRLYITSDGKKRGETDWAAPDGWGTGHGISTLFKKPDYQLLANSSENRSTPDISCIGASPSGMGVSVYNSSNGGWLGVYGTSLSCPLLTGMLATVNSTRLKVNKKKLSRVEMLSYLYNIRQDHNLPFDTMADGIGFINHNFIGELVSI